MWAKVCPPRAPTIVPWLHTWPQVGLSTPSCLPTPRLTILGPPTQPTGPAPRGQDAGWVPVSSLGMGPEPEQTSFRALECVWYFLF